jgi:hypothetical protein
MASIKLKGDTSGEVTISAPSVAGTTTLELPATSSTLATQNALGVRNLIINGDMRIAQRGTSTTLSGTGTLTEYVIDRFYIDTRVDTWNITATQDTDVPSGEGFSNSTKIDVNATTTPTASSNLMFTQSIEDKNVAHLMYGTSDAKTVTLSFWVKSNKTGTYCVQLMSNGGGGTYVLYEYTIDTADTWEKKSITINGDTGKINENKLQINWHLSVGPDDIASATSSWTSGNLFKATSDQVNLADSTSNYINITGIQLEVGTEATPFEHRPYDMELARCQRYYYKHVEGGPYSIGNASYHSSTTLFTMFSLPVFMRAKPSLDATTGTNYYRVARNGSSDTFNDFTLDAASSQSHIMIKTSSNISGTAGHAGWVYSDNSATNAYVALSAEL